MTAPDQPDGGRPTGTDAPPADDTPAGTRTPSGDTAPGRRSPEPDDRTRTHENRPADRRHPRESPGADASGRAVAVRTASASAAGRVLRPLRIEFRRGFVPWAAAALLFALAWPITAAAARWQGSWGDTTDELSAAAGAIAIPFCLAAGAWQGGRERRRRTTELWASTPRSPLARFLTAALPPACALAGAYLVVVAGALLACAPYASAGGPVPTVFAGSALSIAACTVLGQVAGRVLPWRLTAPALAICGYVLAAVGVRSSSGLAGLVPASLRLFGDEDLPVWWYPLVSALWTAGIAGAAVLVHAARRRVTALLPLAAAFAAAVPLVHTGDGMLRDNPLAHHQVCDRSTTPQVCVNATHPGLLPEAARVLSGVTGRLRGVQNLPVRFEDLPRRPRVDEAELPSLTPLGWSSVRGRVADPERYAWQGAVNLIRPDCDATPSVRVQVVDEAVLRWLAPASVWKADRELSVKLARESDGTEHAAMLRAEDGAYARLAALPAGERRSWLGRYFATVGVCDPKASEVPAL
ncbi:hypothetical protein [Streptomyces fagopyri]